MLMDLFISINDILELYVALTLAVWVAKYLNCLIVLVDLAHSIDRTHDQLVKVTAKEQV